MRESRKSRVGGLLVELCVVFVGVFVALAADSWWQSRGERARAAAYVTAVEVEMVLAGAQLDSAIVETERLLGETGDFWSLLQSERILADSVPLVGMQMYPIAIPTGTLDAMLVTGDINLIRGDEVRAVLVEEYARLHASVASHERAMGVFFLTAAGVMPELERARIEGRRPAPFPNAEAVRGNPIITGSYASHLQLLRLELNILRDMRVSVDRILTAVGPS